MSRTRRDPRPAPTAHRAGSAQTEGAVVLGLGPHATAPGRPACQARKAEGLFFTSVFRRARVVQKMNKKHYQEKMNKKLVSRFIFCVVFTCAFMLVLVASKTGVLYFFTGALIFDRGLLGCFCHRSLYLVFGLRSTILRSQYSYLATLTFS